MAARLRAFDWRNHPLGDPALWPAELRTVLGVCLASKMPTAIYWGPEFRLLYNDAWAPIPADRHPSAIGRPAAAVWHDIWPVVGPQFAAVAESRKGFLTHDERLVMIRDGVPEETFWNYSLSPILGAGGEIVGILNQGEETTERVRATRAQAFMVELGDRLRDLTAADGAGGGEVLSAVLEALGRHLGLTRIGYTAIDSGGVSARVIGNWREPHMPDIADLRFDLAEFGSATMANVLAGRPVAIDDVLTDPRLSPEQAARYVDVGVRANLLAPVVRGGRAIALMFLDEDKPRRWSRHDENLARQSADRIWVAVERADTTAQLRASERRFATLFDQAAVGLSEIGHDGRFIRFNEAMGRLLGRELDEASGLAVADVTHADDAEQTRARFADAIGAQEPFELEKRLVRPDGGVVWAVTHVTRVTDAAGASAGFFSVTTDVTERKEQERIRSWLLAELNHRVKNNLSTVQALAHHTRLSTLSPDEFERVFNDRLMALSRAHDLLTRETWTSAALADLVNQTLAPFALDDGDRIVIGGPEVRLSPTAAVTMTLAFHELATNSAKFGALSRPEGRVSVAWLVDPSRDGGVVDLEWRESNGPIVVPPSRRGFGSRLIERGAARELGGQVRLDFQPAGVACAFQLPLSQKIMVP